MKKSDKKGELYLLYHGNARVVPSRPYVRTQPGITLYTIQISKDLSQTKIGFKIKRRSTKKGLFLWIIWSKSTKNKNIFLKRILKLKALT